jgi:hypothetical protein
LLVALHWLLALGIVGNFALGLYMSDLPFSPARLQYFSWHKWAGVGVLAFSAMRLLTRLMSPPPALPQAIEVAMPGWQAGPTTPTACTFSQPLLAGPSSAPASPSCCLACGAARLCAGERVAV